MALDKNTKTCYSLYTKFICLEKSSSFKYIFKFVSNSLTNKSMQGVVKKKTDKGFGFIAIEGEDKDLFFHSNSLVGVSFDEIQEGDNVSFEIEDSAKGKNAVNVQRV